MKVVNDALYHSQANYVTRYGGTVIRGGEEVGKHLDRVGADASSIGDVIMLGEDATTSEALEEVCHFGQHRRSDYSEYSLEITRYLQKRDAQMYLLESTGRYNIPEQEVRQTEEALGLYRGKLREAGVDENTGLHSGG